jgi:hypothetical protein
LFMIPFVIYLYFLESTKQRQQECFIEPSN